MHEQHPRLAVAAGVVATAWVSWRVTRPKPLTTDADLQAFAADLERNEESLLSTVLGHTPPVVASSLGRVLFYPTLCYTMAYHYVAPNQRPWLNPIDQSMVLGALPFASTARELHDLGVRLVVNTCEEWAGPVDEYERLGIAMVRIPTVDYLAPSFDHVERMLAVLEKARQEDADVRVYIHCKAGRGRSTTALICWYVASGQLSPLEAQRMIEASRPQVSKRAWKRRVVKQVVQKYVLDGHALPVEPGPVLIPKPDDGGDAAVDYVVL